MLKKALFVGSLLLGGLVISSLTSSSSTVQTLPASSYSSVSTNSIVSVGTQKETKKSEVSIPTEIITLNKTNSIYLRGEISDDSVSTVIKEAMELDKIRTSDPIYLVLRSPGGSVQAGIDMVNGLKALKRPVHTITVFAASMAFQTAQQLGTRYITPFGVLMSHRAHGGMEGDIGGIVPDQLHNRLQMIVDIMNLFDLDTVKRTNGKQTLESYQKAYASEMWRVGRLAIEEGYADKEALIRCDGLGMETIAIKFFGLEFHVKLSKCPLDNHVELLENETDSLTTDQVDNIKNYFKNLDNYQRSHVIPMEIR